MSLIYTTELHGGNAFHYLTTLMLHEKAVADSPSDWLPWNYRESLARLDGLAHHPSTPTDVVTSDSEPVIDMRGPPLMAMPRRPPRHHNLNSSAGLSTAASALILSADRPFAGGRPNWPPLEARSFAPHLPRTAAGRTRNSAYRIRSLFLVLLCVFLFLWVIGHSFLRFSSNSFYVSLVQIVPPPDTVFHHLVNVWDKQDFAKVRNVFTCVVQVDDLDCLWEMQFGQILDPFGAIA